MVSLYLFDFVNYYNRQIFHYDTIQDYAKYQNLITSIDNYNFNPNDGVDTAIVVNVSKEQSRASYLVIVNEIGVIDSRWFIMDSVRTRSGQYNMTLRRDMIADKFNTVLYDPMFIEKATIPIDNDLIFNSENMTYSQIKSGETLLKDGSGCAWIVGYLKKTADPLRFSVSDAVEVQPDYRLGNLEEYPYYKYNNVLSPYEGNVDRLRICVNATTKNDTDSYTFVMDENNMPALPFLELDNRIYIDNGVYNNPGDNVGLFIKDGPIQYTPEDLRDDFISTARARATDWGTLIEVELPADAYHTKEETDSFLADDGKIILTRSDGRYRKVIIEPLGSGRAKQIATPLSTSPISNEVLKVAESSVAFEANGFEPLLEAQYRENQYIVKFELLPQTANSMEISNNRQHLQDAPYDMFCIPYNPMPFDRPWVGMERSDNTKALKIAGNMIRDITDTYLYDVQIVPYCPLGDGYFISDPDEIKYGIDKDKMTNTKDCVKYQDVRTEDGTYWTTIFWCDVSSRRRLLSYPIEVAQTNPTEFKVQNETEEYHLVSPNYNGQFEFKATKNKGVDTFETAFTYRPYNPYIKVAPTFKGLYGRSYNDARGLICGGSFSLPMISDAWKTYEYNNRNYQQMFDRQIQNMDVNNNVAREQEKWGVIANAISAGTMAMGGVGMMTGGGGLGIGAGAIAGAGAGVASYLIGQKDRALSEQLRTEARDYAQDLFGYQLGNVKAMPYQMTKSSTINQDNKIFPVLEKYTATATERNALRNKIMYDGMTVMATANIATYRQEELKTYIKGKLIRSEIKEDTHFLQSLADELNKGVFI